MSWGPIPFTENCSSLPPLQEEFTLKTVCREPVSVISTSYRNLLGANAIISVNYLVRMEKHVRMHPHLKFPLCKQVASAPGASQFTGSRSLVTCTFVGVRRITIILLRHMRLPSRAGSLSTVPLMLLIS